MSPLDAWAVKRALIGQDLTDSLPRLSRMVRVVVEHLGRLPSAEARGIAWQAVACTHPDRDQIVKAVDEADPTEAPPEGDVGLRSAHLGDLVTRAAERRFVWPGWIVRGEFNLLSADAKVGKTHLMLDLARRFWFQLPMPDGSESPLPPRAHTLWVCGARRQNDLRARASAFGLPDEAVRLSARPKNPYGGWNLDEARNVTLLHELVLAERPALVVINTVGHATRGHVRREEKFHALLEPILEIAQATDTAIVGLMHFPRGGETLGRRLEGLACSVMRLARPDPEHQPSRRKLTATGTFEEPPALGVTFFGDRCEYDRSPPSAPEPRRPGRPAERRAEAISFLDEKLADGPQRAAELIRKWQELGGNEGTLLNARNTMQADGRLSVQALQRLQMWLRTQRGEHQPTGAAVEGSEGGDHGQESADAQIHQHS